MSATPEESGDLDRVYAALRDVVEARDWGQFHSPASLARSVSIEAGELLECFQWNDDADHERVLAEVADVLTYCFLLADTLGADPHELILDKLRVTQGKYPVEKAYGQSTKYDQL